MESLHSATVAELLRLMPHLEVAHHVPGRIRLRILLSGLRAVQDVDLQSLVLTIPGVLCFRVNTCARSVVIEYDQQKLPYELWETVKQLKSRPELAPQFVNRLSGLLNR
jgi:hypothetical protein